MKLSFSYNSFVKLSLYNNSLHSRPITGYGSQTQRYKGTALYKHRKTSRSLNVLPFDYRSELFLTELRLLS